MTSNRLPVLAENIRTHHRAALDAAGTATRHAITCGEMLIEAKKELNHGEWLPWLKGHCEISERTAQAYMRVARKIAEMGTAESAAVADLPLRGALKAIAGPQDKPAPWDVNGPFVDDDFEKDALFPRWIEWKISHAVGLSKNIRAALSIQNDYGLPALAMCPAEEIRDALERIAAHINDKSVFIINTERASPLEIWAMLKLSSQRILVMLFDEVAARQKKTPAQNYDRAERTYKKLGSAIEEARRAAFEASAGANT